MLSVKLPSRVEIHTRIEMQKFRHKLFLAKVSIKDFKETPKGCRCIMMRVVISKSFCAIMDNLSISWIKERVRQPVERYTLFYVRRGYPKTKSIHSVKDRLEGYCGLCLNTPFKPSSTNGSLLPVSCGECHRACGQIYPQPYLQTADRRFMFFACDQPAIHFANYRVWFAKGYRLYCLGYILSDFGYSSRSLIPLLVSKCAGMILILDIETIARRDNKDKKDKQMLRVNSHFR
uniref:Uncharacterized protein n=1 Tax=Glossina palpalis gambiensis TaxID=67801 RepID=A0A1B0AWT3_9MUSC